MGFLRKLFGGGEKKPREYVDEQGIYFYVKCDSCGTIVRVRADKQYDLNRDSSGYSWRKTVVDNKCFRRMEALVQFDSHYRVTNREISGGRFVTEADYEAFLRPDVSEPTDGEEEEG